MLRLLRLVRVIRLLRIFKELWLLVNGSSTHGWLVARIAETILFKVTRYCEIALLIRTARVAIVCLGIYGIHYELSWDTLGCHA